jgi:uncharacterized protein DUF29
VTGWRSCGPRPAGRHRLPADRDRPGRGAPRSDLYEDDILLWSEQQAEALRRRAANEIDWDNIAEEVEALGRSERNAVESHLQQALLHDIEAEGGRCHATCRIGARRPAVIGMMHVEFHAVDGAEDRRGGALTRGAASAARDDR